ncbi:MAG: guanylate kinase [SAR202 cluster bacterium]|nr:guanylate kinase [SAR202 cluster bacterium]
MNNAANGHKQSILLVLSGPSGVGKDAVLNRMKAAGRPYHFTVTCTTRPKRASETEGKDYIFLTSEKFREMLRNGEFLESAEVYGNYYGVPKRQVMDALNAGKDVIIKTDIQGAATIRKLAPNALFIFLAPPSMEELAARLTLRMTESPEALRRRLDTAEKEMRESSRFDYVVVNENDRIDEAVHAIEEIMERERMEARRRVVAL